MSIVRLQCDPGVNAASALKKKLRAAGFVVRLAKKEREVYVQTDPLAIHATVTSSQRVGDVGAEAYRSRFTETLDDFLWNDWMYIHIDNRLHHRHSYLTDDEREYLTLLTLHGLRKTADADMADVRQSIHEGVEEAVRTAVTEAQGQMDGFISLDAIMRFRAKAWLQSLDEGIEEVVEQFLADREYEEFVSLLRYMLESQPLSQQKIHVFCTDERVWMCDETGELISDEEVSRAAYQVSEDGEVNVEDLAMSVLITRSPCKIVIHDVTHGAPWPSFSETLERVFLERAIRCSNCSACAELEKHESLGRLHSRRRRALHHPLDFS